MTTLKEFIKDLELFAKKHPELLDKPVGYFSDDEGNWFSTNVYPPSVIYYHKRDSETLDESEYNIYLNDDEECVEGFEMHILIN